MVKGEMLAVELVPCPVNVTCCVLPALPPLLSVKVSVPVAGPVVVGSNWTATVQELPAVARVIEDVVEHVEAAVFIRKAPVIAMPPPVPVWAPVLFT